MKNEFRSLAESPFLRRAKEAEKDDTTYDVIKMLRKEGELLEKAVRAEIDKDTMIVLPKRSGLEVSGAEEVPIAVIKDDRAYRAVRRWK